MYNMWNKRYIGMKCYKCKIVKDLSKFWDYDTLKPSCIKCKEKKRNSIEIYYWPFKFNKEHFTQIYKIQEIKQDTNNRVEVIKNIKERKNQKREYPKEFSDKRKILLDDARNNEWCTACWINELLQVHHIDRNKFNNNDNNLIVLCYYCHSKEHKHMQWKKPPKWLK